MREHACPRAGLAIKSRGIVLIVGLLIAAIVGLPDRRRERRTTSRGLGHVVELAAIRRCASTVVLAIKSRGIVLIVGLLIGAIVGRPIGGRTFGAVASPSAQHHSFRRRLVLHTAFTSLARSFHEGGADDPSSSGIGRDMELFVADFALNAALLERAALLHDGLGPGGYAALFWMILFVFVVGLLVIFGFVALLIWFILRRRAAGRR
jgi:hypothetical protein